MRRCDMKRCTAIHVECQPWEDLVEVEKRAAFNQVKVSNAMRIQVGTFGAASSSAHVAMLLERAQALQLDKDISMEAEPGQSATKKRSSTCPVVLATALSAAWLYTCSTSLGPTRASESQRFCATRHRST